MKNKKELKKLNFSKEKISAMSLEQSNHLKGGGEVPVDENKDELWTSRVTCFTNNNCTEHTRCNGGGDNNTITIFCIDIGRR